MSVLQSNFFDDQIFYRVIPGFLTQFGVAANPAVMKKWNDQRFPDEPKKASFEHGTVSFAGAGADSRSCHVFIAMEPNGLGLGGALHETPLGRIVTGIGFLDKLTDNYEKAGYPDLTELQGQIGQEGNSAAKAYPKLDRIHTCRLAGKGDEAPGLLAAATNSILGVRANKEDTNIAMQHPEGVPT